MANSTVMFSGINPEGRNSSKVLRPPGGGSSLGPFSADCEEVATTKAAPAKAEVVVPAEKDEVTVINLGVFLLFIYVQVVVEPTAEAPSAAAEVAEIPTPEVQPAATIPPPSAEAPTEEAPAPAVAVVEEAAPAAATEEVKEAPHPAPAPVVTEEAPAAPAAPSTVYRPPVAGVRGRVPPGGHTSGPFW